MIKAEQCTGWYNVSNVSVLGTGLKTFCCFGTCICSHTNTCFLRIWSLSVDHITWSLKPRQRCNHVINLTSTILFENVFYHFILKTTHFSFFPCLKIYITLFYSNFIFLLHHTVSLKLIYGNTCIVGTHKYAAASEVVCTCAWAWAWDFSSFSICSYYSLNSNT